MTGDFDARTYKETTREQWQAAADAWHRWHPTLQEWLGPATDALLDMAGVGTGDHVLDIAAGAGQQRNQILVVNILFAVGQLGEGLVNGVQLRPGQGKSQLGVAACQRMAAGMLAEYNAVAGRAHLGERGGRRGAGHGELGSPFE